MRSGFQKDHAPERSVLSFQKIRRWCGFSPMLSLCSAKRLKSGGISWFEFEFSRSEGGLCLPWKKVEANV